MASLPDLTRPLRIAVWRMAQALASPTVARLPGGLWYRWRSRAAGSVDLTSAGGVLVVRLDRIGDAVLTTPLLRELRRAAPGAEITLVVRPDTEPLFAHCPYVDRLLTFDPDAEGPFRQLALHVRALRLARKELWGRTDLALLPRYDSDSYHGTFLVHFSGARRRAAFSETVNDHRAAANRGYNRLLTDTLPALDGVHEVERNLAVLRALGGTPERDELELWPQEADRAFAEELWRSRRLGSGGPVIALGVGASHPRKVWPAARYAEVAERLAASTDARFILLGGPGERELGAPLRRAGGAVVDLIGETTLPQAAALLERCDLYLGNDTGLLHMAAATDTPVVGMWCNATGAPVGDGQSPERFGPWRVPHRVVRPETPRSPCVGSCAGLAAHCIMHVGVVEVVAAAEEILGCASQRSGRGAGVGHAL